MSRILVTGASGFIGSRLLPLLAERGLALTALSRRPPPVGQAALADWHQADLAAGQNLPAGLFKGVEAVVHLAAIAHSDLPDDSETRRRLTATNVEAPRDLARRAAAAGVPRFLFLSSATVHGATSGSAAFTEDSPLAPRGPYAESKVAAEEALRRLANDGAIALTIVRPPLVYGPGVKGNLARLLAWAERRRPLPSAVSRNRRSVIGLDNLCGFLATAIDHTQAAGETFLVADGETVSTGTLFARLSHALGREPHFLPLPYPLLAAALRPLGRGALLDRLCGDFRLDAGRAARLLDWRPDVTMEEELARTAAWWRTLAPASKRQ